MSKQLIRADGNWVVAERFWDREADVRLLIEKIEEGSHARIVAQRRIGKTSLMREVGRRIEGRFICLFVDFQDCQKAEDAIAALAGATKPHERLWRRTRQAFANALRGVAGKVDAIDLKLLRLSLRTGLSPADWQAKGDSVFESLAASDVPVVLFLDEVAILISRLLRSGDADQGRVQADLFLSWLRRNSIEHKGKVRIIVTGSIGLEPILARARLGATINTFPAFHLDPWDRQVALDCLHALAAHYAVSFGSGAVELMLDKLGCLIPHHVQMFFDHVYMLCRRRGRMTCSVQDVEEVYRQRMLGSRGQMELSHYEERLETVLGDEMCALAFELVTEAAVTGLLGPEAMRIIARDYEFEGREIGDVVREILGILEHDGYLQKVSGGYTFVSHLLRDWWRGRNEAFYVPTARRGA